METRDRERWVVSPSTLISWCDGRIEIAAVASGALLQTGDLDVLHVIHAFARARPIGEVVHEFPAYPREHVAACIDDLIETGVLIRSSEEDPMTVYGWERSALAFHRTSRKPRFVAERSPEAPPVAPRRSPRTIPLDRTLAEGGRDLSDVLWARRSWRAWPSRPIPGKAFSTLLWMSARNRGLPSKGGNSHVSRPYPSGGARYSLELYPVIAPRAVESIPAGVYRYLPESHALEPISEDAADCVPFLEAAGRSAGSDPPPVVLVVTSRIPRQSEAYGDLAYSLVLKEVGALFQTLYLAAEYLELAPCALGGGTPDELLARLCTTTELAEPVVGEFMVGPR